MTNTQLHPKYEEYLSKQGHVEESTLATTRRNLANFPEPENLNADWFRERMKHKAPATIKKEWVLANRILRSWGLDKIALSVRELPKIEEPVTVEDLYTKDELSKIFMSAVHTRDRAIVAVLYESASRASELLSMKIENLSFEEDGTASITVTGKTGTRSIPLYESVPSLKAWLEVHPKRKGYIWTDIKEPYQPLKYPALYQVVSRIIASASLKREKKKVLHMFRHTRATELVRKGVRGQSLSKFMGWTKKSNMEAVYVHLSTQDVNNEMRSKVFGLDAEQEEPKPLLESLTCPSCHTKNQQGALICSKCNMPLSNDMIVSSFLKKEQQEHDLEHMQERIDSLENTLNEALLLLRKIDSESEAVSVKDIDRLLKKK